MVELKLPVAAAYAPTGAPLGQTTGLLVWATRGVLLLACGGVIDSPPTAAAPAKTVPPRRSRATAPRAEGVDTGIVKAATALFLEPNGTATKIGVLGKGDLLVLVSRDTSDGWLNVIQFSSGRQGWVKAERLITHYTQRRTSALELRGELLGSPDPPTVQITNDSDKSFYVHLGTLPEFQVKPHTTRNVTVSAGLLTFNAAAPNVLPVFGSNHFLNGTTYNWRFFIRRHASQRTPRPVDPNLVAECKRLQAEVDTSAVEVKIEKRQIDADRSALEFQTQTWKRHSEEMEAHRQTLDRTDQSAVDAFNDLVRQVNKELEALQEAERRFDAEIEAYNTKLNALHSARQRLEKLSDAINASN